MPRFRSQDIVRNGVAVSLVFLPVTESHQLCGRGEPGDGRGPVLHFFTPPRFMSGCPFLFMSNSTWIDVNRLLMADHPEGLSAVRLFRIDSQSHFFPTSSLYYACWLSVCWLKRSNPLRPAHPSCALLSITCRAVVLLSACIFLCFLWPCFGSAYVCVPPPLLKSLFCISSIPCLGLGDTTPWPCTGHFLGMDIYFAPACFFTRLL